jgi:hypothetical protein
VVARLIYDHLLVVAIAVLVLVLLAARSRR